MARRFFPSSKSTKRTPSESAHKRLYSLLILLIALQLFTIGLLVMRTGGVLETTSEPMTANQTLSQMESFVKPMLEDTGQKAKTDTLLSEESREATPQVWDTPTRVQILNGCGVRGVGQTLSPVLRRSGFDVREIGNADRFNYNNTLVLDRVGERGRALAFADSFGIQSNYVRTERDEKLVDIDVTLIVGRDYKNLKFNTDR
ncbi:LytR C-terminal domain-containing protein [bacterium]|nr:LytR C-terminal domain-containing protein [bacterium]